MTVTIEWLVEELEYTTPDADIMDTHCFPTLAEARAFAAHCHLVRFGLVRDRGNDLDGLLDRQWAYVEDGKLPEYFDGGILVPAKFHKELERQ